MSLFFDRLFFLDFCCLHQRLFLSKNQLLFHRRNHDSPLPGTMGNATVSLNPNLLKSDLSSTQKKELLWNQLTPNAFISACLDWYYPFLFLQDAMHTTTVTTMDTTTRITNRKPRPKVVCLKVNLRRCKCKHHNQASQISNKNQHGVLNSRNHRFVIDKTEGF